jgi:putative ABC transport system permease protein
MMLQVLKNAPRPPLRRPLGRTFSEQDREPAPAAAIVNATFVRRYLAGRDPIGIRVRFGDSGDDWITIVGVAGDSRNVGLRDPPTPLLYLPYHSFPLPFMSIAARSAASPGAVASIVRSEVKKIDPDLPVDRIVPMREVLQDSVAEPRFRTLLLSMFALMATALAAVGLYGLMSYAVAQRTREIGIRVALGAQARQVMGPVLREGMTLAVIGVALGLAGSLAASRALGGFLFGVEPTDPLTYGSVAVLLLAVALAASYIPSRRALRVDPIIALRSE